MVLLLLQLMPISPARVARQVALRARRVSSAPTNPARAPRFRYNAKGGCEKGAKGHCVLDMLRAASATSVHHSGHQGGRYARCECLTWDARYAADSFAAFSAGSS